MKSPDITAVRSSQSVISMSTASAFTRPTKAAQDALHLLRCQVFQTTYNPSAVRTGAKYLKKRLRGQAMIDYITPSVALDVARGSETYVQRIKEGTTSLTKLRKVMEDPEFRPEGRPMMRLGPWWQTEDPENPNSKLKSFDKEAYLSAVRSYKAGAEARGDVAAGFEEVDHSDVAYDWLRDSTEVVRVKEVAARKAEGRGPPKKGKLPTRMLAEPIVADTILFLRTCRTGQAFTDEAKVERYTVVQPRADPGHYCIYPLSLESR